jgi:hypothetical protein
MKRKSPKILTINWKKLAAFSLVISFAVVSFATLGDGRNKSDKSKKLSLSNKMLTASNFSLKSGYVYRGNDVLNTEPTKKFISLNTFASVQKGNVTYTVPLKKNVFLDNVKIDIGNRQFQKN